jgi:hypothetical protein
VDESEKILQTESEWIEDNLLLRLKGEIKLAKKDYHEAFNSLNMVKGNPLSVNIFL